MISRFSFALCGFVILTVGRTTFAAPGAPTGLLCELMRRPDLSVITSSTPRFGWIVNDSTRGAVQKAYQIIVSSSAEQAKGGRGELWDSGRVESKQSISVVYAGKPLAANSTYFWAVRMWDSGDEPSPWSKPQRFNTGELGAKRDWPGASRWVKIKGSGGADLWTFENRHPIQYHELDPQKVVKKAGDHVFIDFGRAAFATLKLTLTAASEGEVEVRLGEKLASRDTIDPKPGGSIYYGAHKLAVKQGTHTYTLSLPRHVSKYPNSQVLAQHMPEVEPFRYAEVIGPLSEIKPADVKQVALFYLWDDAASSFTSSDPELNAVWELCRYTMKATSFMGVYTDGVRERMPYEADAMIQQLGHYCTDREYAIARYSHEYLLHNATWPSEWILQSVEMAWNDYLYTGDDTSLRRQYDLIKAKALSALEREDGLISTRAGKLTREVMDSVHYKGKALKDIVDWPQPSEIDGFEFKDYNAVVNLWHLRAIQRLEQIAHVLRTEDFAPLLVKRINLERVVGNSFFDKATQHYVDGIGSSHSSLHANAFAVAFLKDFRKPVIDFVKSRGMACGPYGAQFLVEGLYDGGEAEYALSLLTSRSDRSWMNMIHMGSTMATEAWDAKFKKNLTWNHAWGAAPANLIPRKLMGVEPTSPGFATVRIKPQPAGLEHAALKMPTIRGTIEVGWKRAGDKTQLNVTIPANMKASVYIPAKNLSQITESSAPVLEARGVSKSADSEKGWTVLSVGGGEYRFEFPN